ncbi:AIM24 family protein [Paenibacillus sepulcri]
MEIISRMGGAAASQQSAVELQLREGDAVHVLHPQQIAAFQGLSRQREDKFMNMQGIYRKKKLIKSKLSGPSSLILGLPGGYMLHCMELDGDSSLLFDFRHLLFYTEGIEMKSVLQSFKNVVATKDIMRMKFQGHGAIGLISCGPVIEMELDPVTPSFIDSRALIAFPSHVGIDLSVYGNHLASQHMSYQWKMTGTGKVLLQVGWPDAGLEQFIGQDSLVKRLLREIVPFGGIWFK